MGWKGTLRSLSAASRQMERAQQRRRRELLQQQKEIDKLEALQRATYEVEVYENYVQVLQSVHKDCSAPWDWAKVKASAPPSEPPYSDALERVERARQEQYQPSWLDRLLGRAQAKIDAMNRSIETARAADQRNHAQVLEEYRSDCQEWDRLQSIAAGS